jgi:predicted transcriptional regulator
MAVSKLVAVRVPDELAERLDEYARRMEQLHGLKLSRSQVIKSLCELGLKAADAGAAAPARKS